jgi:hypothetical protein
MIALAAYINSTDHSSTYFCVIIKDSAIVLSNIIDTGTECFVKPLTFTKILTR